MSAPAALVLGAGGVLGVALCREFADAGYRVIGIRRRAAAAAAAAAQARLLACDLGDPAATMDTVRGAVAELGVPDVVVCNAARFSMAPFCELALADFAASWNVGVASAVACAQAVMPPMAARGTGAFIVTGATASLRGSARFTAFAAAKFALRGFAQALAREFQPRGVHVAHVVLDGILRDSDSATRFGKRAEECLDPAAVAANYRMLAEQPANSWTHEIDLRPGTERF